MRKAFSLLIAASLILAAPGPNAWAAVRAAAKGSTAIRSGMGGFRGVPSVSLQNGTSLAAPSLGAGSLSLPNAAVLPEAAQAAPASARAARSRASFLEAEPLAVSNRADAPRGKENDKPAAAYAQAEGVRESVARIEAREDAPADAAEIKDVMDAVFDAGLRRGDATGAEAVAAEGVSRRPGRWARLLPAGAAAGAAAVGVSAVANAPAAALAENAAADAVANAVASLGWTPEAALTAAIVLPFALFVVPSLFNGIVNSRAFKVSRLAAGVAENADRRKKEGYFTSYQKDVKRKRGGSVFLDRVTVRVPEGAEAGDRKFKRFGVVEILSQRAVPQEDGSWRVDSYSFKYSGKGKPRAGWREVQKARKIGGKIEREGLFSDLLGPADPFGRGLLARWAPHESGKFWSFFAGALASLPAYFMAAATAHPIELFLWTGAGLLAGYLGERWRLAQPRTRFRAKHGESVIYYAAAVAGTATFFLASIPAGMSLVIGMFGSVLLSRYVLPTSSFWIESPLKRRAARRGTAFSKFKLTLAALFATTLLGITFNPSPIDANDKAELAARMQTGPVGVEYADFMKEHEDVEVYVVKPWHREDMSTAVGRHYDKVPMIGPARIMLNAESYDIRHPRDWEALELALSTLVHEFDHDRTEVENDGAPYTVEHEHSAWDHQARFIIEQFENNPDLFKPGRSEFRKLAMLERAQRWLEEGPASYREHVSKLYDKNPELAKVKVPNKDALEKFYADHRAEMQAEWEARKDDASLKENLSKAIQALDWGASDPALAPSGSSILGLLSAGFGSFLALFGLGGLVSRVRNRKK
jgi:hypothetical protein